MKLHDLIFDVHIAVRNWVGIWILCRKHKRFKVAGPQLDHSVVQIDCHKPPIILGIYFLCYLVDNFRATIAKADVFLQNLVIVDVSKFL